MAATTRFSGRPSLGKVLLSLSLFSTLIFAQNAPPYGSGTAATCPDAADGTAVTVNGDQRASVYTIYCNYDIGGGTFNRTATSFDQCLVFCENSLQCGAVVYRDGTCYIKPVSNPGNTRFPVTDGSNLGVKGVVTTTTTTTTTPIPTTTTTTTTPTPSPTLSVSSSEQLTCTTATTPPVASDTTTTTNGVCGINNGLNCGNGFGECCSIYGFCGSTSDYCAPSECDPGFGRCATAGGTTTNGFCGVTGNNAICGSNFGDCCSQYGACGNTTDYCGLGCDPAYGRCDGSPTPNGYCGATNNGWTCGSVFGDCCSQYGSCGNDTAYCGTGCDPTYGRCDNATPPTYIPSSVPPQYPSGAETSTAAAPTATQSGGLTPNGYCGPDNNDYICGGDFGPCCSQYGSCGIGDAYCGADCKSTYGLCDTPLPACPVSSSSSSSEISSTSSSSSSSSEVFSTTESSSSIPDTTTTTTTTPFPTTTTTTTSFPDTTTTTTTSLPDTTTTTTTSFPDTTTTTTTPFPTTTTTPISTTTTTTTSFPDTTTTTTTTSLPDTTTTTTTPFPTTTTTPIPTTTTTTTTPIPTTTTTTTLFPGTTTTTTTPFPTTTTTTTTTPFPTTTTTTTSSTLISSISSSPSSSSSSSSTATFSTSIGIVNRAVCGPVYGGQSCYGSGFGNCCSANNQCGSTDDFCGPGCQIEYGDCYPVSSSSSSTFLSSSIQASIPPSYVPPVSSSTSSAVQVATTTISSVAPTNTFPIRVPECARNCLAESDLQGCDPMDVSCICRNNDLIADYSCCLALSCSSNMELMAIMAIGRALCACYGYFGLPTSAGCTAPAYSATPSATLIDQSPTTTSTNFVTPTASTCGNILESITDQIPRPSSTSSTVTAPPSVPASTTASITATPIPTSALPPCAKPCIATYEQTSCFGGCSPLDVACICSNTVLVDSLSCCVAQTCDEAGQEAVSNFADALCAQYGVYSLPESASCAPTTTPSNGLAIPSSTIPGCSSTALITSATATPTGLPPCAQPCIASYASSSCYGGCSPLDVTCICSNKPLLNELSCCVSTSCDGAGEAEVVRFAQNLCQQYGVFDLPYSAGCASTLAIGATSTTIGSCATTTSGLVGGTCVPCPKICEKRTTVLAITAGSY